MGRLLQGFSAAIVWSVGCALLVDTVGDSIGVAMGYVNIAMSMGLLIAPVIGGAVYDAAGYYAVFYIAFGIVVLDIALRLFMIEKKVAQQWELPDENSPHVSAPGGDVEKPIPTANAEGIFTTDSDEPRTVPTVPTSNIITNDTSGPVDSERVPISHGMNPGSLAPQPTETSQNRRKRDGIIMLLKSPRLMVALYGIMVEAGLM